MRKTKRMLAVVIAVMMIFTAFPMTANAATKNVYNFNVSNSKVTKNASEGKLPANANPVYVGGKYYFNLQVSNDIKLKIAELYIKYPGSNKFEKKHTENAKNYFRYVYTSQSVGNKEGSLTYYWKVMNTSGKWKSQAKKTVNIVKKPVTSIALNKSNIRINVGSAYKLTATVKPSDATYKNVSWSSKDSRVASVDRNGNVTAKKTGKTTVTATADGKSASCTVEVVQVKVTPKNISSCSITIPDVTYTGKPLTPEPVVKDGSKILKKGTDYTTQYSNNVNAGTGKVVITGKGNYTGSVTKTFKINKAKDSISVTPTPVFKYSNKKQTISLTVKSKFGLKLSAKSNNSYIGVKINGNKLTITIPAIHAAIYTGSPMVTVNSTGNGNVNGAKIVIPINISNKDKKREAVINYMKSMATVKWTPSKSFTHWSGSNNGPGVWKAGTTYYGIPYTQDGRYTNLADFNKLLKKGAYVGPTEQDKYRGNDCSSALSYAWQQANPKFQVTTTLGFMPSKKSINAVGNYKYNNYSYTTSICTANGKKKIVEAYKKLQPGDALLCTALPSLKKNHVMLVTSVSKDSVKVTHQTKYNSKLHSTWRVDEKMTFDTLFKEGYVPVTMSNW